MISVSVHDSHPREEATLVDLGLGEANEAAAPLEEVERLSCFARMDSGAVVGGAVGRWWGECCELQQLWVAPSHRRQGLGGRLLAAFEARAKQHGCCYLYLETFSFQSPQLYRSLGFQVENERKGFPQGIVKYLMVKDLSSP